jgi:Rap1a immunity proteins
MRNLSWVLILALIACCPAEAAQMTVAELQAFCTSRSEEAKVACGFYIWGVTEGASLGSGSEQESRGKLREKRDKLICMPEGVGKSEMQRLVTDAIARDLAKFPDDRDMPAVSFVMAVAANKFPCGQH